MVIIKTCRTVEEYVDFYRKYNMVDEHLYLMMVILLQLLDMKMV